MTEHPIGLVPLGIVHNDDRRGELMELIGAQWQSGRLALWGRRKDTSFPIKKINQYKGLELLWMAGPPRDDYYCDVGAHPSVIGKAGYYRHLWEEIHIREEDLVRVRNEVLSSGRVGLATHKPHACGSAMPSDVRHDLEEARSFHDQPMPDPAGLQRLSEALAQLREKARSAIRSREARQTPADVMEERCQQAGEDVNGELLVGFARGRISAFLDTHFGVERLPCGPYWLLADGGATLEGKRALLGTASSNRHHGLAGIVKVHVADFRDFANAYLTERRLAEPERSGALAGPTDFFMRLGWILLNRAVEIIKKVEGDTAWHQVETAIRLKELPARCLADGVTTDFEPHWLDFLAWNDAPETAALWFDREKAWRKAGRPVDRAGVPAPDRAENIVMPIARCAELWPRCSWPAVAGVVKTTLETEASDEANNGSTAIGIPERKRRPGPTPTGVMIRTAAQELFADGQIPAKTITWKEFQTQVCRKLGVKPEQRGYSLDTIQAAVRTLLSGGQVGENTE